MQCRDIGPHDASIMLIGEAPGRHEEEAGIPFVGQSGMLLKAMLNAAQINYDSCFVTNISPERPPSNNFGYFYEDSKRNLPKESLRKLWFELGRKIKQVDPKVVICLGDEPLRAVTNLRGIGSWRGTRIEAYGTKIIATYHPANILRSYSNRVIAEMDLQKAKREMIGIDYQEPIITISPTLDIATEWLWKACELKAPVSFDIETIGTNIRCIAFAQRWTNGINSICIPFFRMLASSDVVFTFSAGSTISIGGNNDINYWSQEDEETILELIASLMESKEIKKIGQNSLSFDSPLIENNFSILTNNHYLDLMHAWHVLYPTLPKSLDFISSVLTDHPNYWTNHIVSVDQSEWHYNCMDTVATLEAAEKVIKELEECLEKATKSNV